jgi:hypothetical protein
MSQDYRLIDSYKQIHNKQSAQPPIDKKKQTLSEVYTAVLEEQYKYAIYAKELEGNTMPPETIEGANRIGYTEFPQRLKSMLNAVESVKSFEDLTPEWKKAAGFSAKYASQKLIEMGLSIDNLMELARQKGSLTAFETNVVSGNTFNFKEIVVANVVAALKDDSLKPVIENAFDYLINIKPTVGGAAAGKGELVATVFTNAIKPDRGDLAFPATKLNETDPITGITTEKDVQYIVELKYGKSRFGKENSKIVYDKSSFYTTLQTLMDKGNKFDPTFSNKVINIRKYLKDIKNLENSNEHIKPEYFADVEHILQNPTEKINVSTNKLFNLMPGMVVAEYLKDTKEAIKPEKEIVKAFKQKHKTVVEKLRDLLNVDKQHKKLDSVPTQAILDYAEKNSPASILKTLFTRNIGLTSDKAATLFCSMYNLDQVPQEIVGKVNEFFASHYHRMALGHKEYLDAILFAFNLAVYSEEDDFDGLLLINDDNSNAISFDASKGVGNIIETASAKFIQNSDHMSITYTNNIYRRLEVHYKK